MSLYRSMYSNYLRIGGRGNRVLHVVRLSAHTAGVGAVRPAATAEHVSGAPQVAFTCGSTKNGMPIFDAHVPSARAKIARFHEAYVDQFELDPDENPLLLLHLDDWAQPLSLPPPPAVNLPPASPQHLWAIVG